MYLPPFWLTRKHGQNEDVSSIPYQYPQSPNRYWLMILQWLIVPIHRNYEAVYLLIYHYPCRNRLNIFFHPIQEGLDRYVTRFDFCHSLNISLYIMPLEQLQTLRLHPKN